MRLLRSPWLRQWVVTALVIGLVLPFADSPDRQGTAEAHAAWLRAHLSGPVPTEAHDAFEHALDVAQSNAASSPEAFTDAFADAYTAQAPAVALHVLFAIDADGAGRLYTVLQRRAQHLGRTALPAPRVMWDAATTVLPTSTSAHPAAAAWVSSAHGGFWNALASRLEVDSGRTMTTIVHLLSAAQPMGP